MSPSHGSSAGIQATTHVLWARSKRYDTPFVLGAWSEGYRHVFAEQFWEEVHQCKAFVYEVHELSDGPWEFVLTVEHMVSPAESRWADDDE